MSVLDAQHKTCIQIIEMTFHKKQILPDTRLYRLLGCKTNHTKNMRLHVIHFTHGVRLNVEVNGWPGLHVVHFTLAFGSKLKFTAGPQISWMP